MQLLSVLGVLSAVGLAAALALAAFANAGVLLLPWPFSAEVTSAPLPWGLLGFALGGALLVALVLLPPLLSAERQRRKLLADLAEREKQLLALLSLKFARDEEERA